MLKKTVQNSLNITVSEYKQNLLFYQIYVDPFMHIFNNFEIFKQWYEKQNIRYFTVRI